MINVIRCLISMEILSFFLCWANLPASPRFIIDAHSHAPKTQKNVDIVARVYREQNAMRCVFTRMEQFELMKKAIADYPDVFIGYGHIDPDDPDAVREIEKFYQAGFVGMKFHFPQKNWDDPKYWQLYRMCEHLGLLMVFHTGICDREITDTPSFASSMHTRPGYLDLIARAFPRAVIQGAHFGDPWYEEAAEVCRFNPNVYFDVTWATLPKLIKLNDLARFKKILWWSMPEGQQSPFTKKGSPHAFEHIVFGTDAWGLPKLMEQFQMFLEANDVPESIREKMWGLTMARILDIDPETRRFRHPRPLPPGSRYLFAPSKFSSEEGK